MFNNLRQLKYFSNLSNKQLDCLLKGSSEVWINSGEVLFFEGNLVKNLYILLEGQLEITKNVNGQQILLTVLQPGIFTYEIPLLAGTDYIVTGRALCKSYLLRFNIDDFTKNIFNCFPIKTFIFVLFCLCKR